MTARAKRRRRKSDARWSTLELAMIRTATFMDCSIYEQVNWLYKNHIKGRTRAAIRRKMARMLKIKYE